MNKIQPEQMGVDLWAHKENKTDELLRDQIAEQLFNQSCVYHGGLKECGWADDYVQSQVESKNCRFHTEQVLKAIDSLGYELKQKDLSA